VAKDGQLFVADPGLGAVLTAESVSGPWEELKFKNANDEALKSIQPSALAIGSYGELYVADQKEGRILITSPSGEILDILEGLSEPSGLALDSEGKNLFVSERARHQIRIYEVKSETRHKEWDVSIP